MDNSKVEGYEHTNYLVHIYVTYANSVVQDCVLKNKKTSISRARIERDITRLIHQNEDLSLPFKIACTSMVLHTNMFDSFWYGCKINSGLSSRSIKRMTPDYDLVDEIPCPRDSDSSATTTTSSSLPLTPDSRNGDSGNVSTGDESTNGKKRAATKKKNGARKPPAKRKVPVKPKAKRANNKTKAAPLLKSVAKPTGVVKNTAPPKETSLPPLKRSNRPIGPTAREAFEISMARYKDETYTLGGPESGTESSESDDESDSDEEMTKINPIRT